MGIAPCSADKGLDLADLQRSAISLPRMAKGSSPVQSERRDRKSGNFPHGLLATICLLVFLGPQRDLSQWIAVTRPSGIDVATHSLRRVSSESELEEEFRPGGVDKGFLSSLPKTFFQTVQNKIDSGDPDQRCQRYGFSYDKVEPKNRRIFYGALIANEPWELLEIVAAETYGIFAGMVFAESNRTQGNYPRNYTHFGQPNREAEFRELFGTQNVLIKSYVNEDISRLDELDREHKQRQEILKGWKELGMQPDDIGYLTDVDETFTRDLLRAAQTCDTKFLDYEHHHCKPLAGLRGLTEVFETSPECIADGRYWYHPSMVIGHCIELIGDESKNPLAIREDDYSSFRHEDEDYMNKELADQRYPLYNGGDFRTVGGHTVEIDSAHWDKYEKHTAYHFHYFFTRPEAIRFKYLTYGHPVKNANIKALEDLHEDLAMVVGCVRDKTHPQSTYSPKPLDDDGKEFQPIYFHDEAYRKKRHDAIRDMILNDEAERAHLLKAAT